MIPTMSPPPVPTDHLLTGIGVAPGIARGHVHLIDRRREKQPRHRVEPERVGDELARLDHAWQEAREALTTLLHKAGDHSAIVEAHLLMLQDPMLVDGTRRQVVDDHKCAEWAIRATVQEIRARFDALGDAYFRERRSDVDFVGDRLLDALGPGAVVVDDVPADAVIVAHDLSPGDAISLSKRGVRAFVTEVGGSTSHTAILARALEIPAVIACRSVLERAARGEACIVDGERGEVVLSPSADVIARYDEEAGRRRQRAEALLRELELPAETPDGHRVALLANVEIPEEVAPAVTRGAEGVGLYRSEFLFLNRTTLPTAAEHEAVCRAILGDLAGRSATLRTFDLGSDKMSAAMRAPREQNPALGLRGVRLGLARPAALRAQLRGMALALSAHRHGQILVPMVGNVDELRAVKQMLHEELDVLAAEGVDVWRGIKVGVMIELPSAVWIADVLAGEADFFSVGTNDLIQYMLAIDRSNEHVAHLYQPLHPAVLKALRHVIDAGHRRGIPVGLCGEMASDPRLTPICLGLGFDSLSMPTSSLRDVKHVVRTFSHEDARALVAACCEASGPEEAAALLEAARGHQRG
jgi:phosphoenolpyruvate-protein phosphotransferase (PTS system enzyme I)